VSEVKDDEPVTKKEDKKPDTKFKRVMIEEDSDEEEEEPKIEDVTDKKATPPVRST